MPVARPRLLIMPDISGSMANSRDWFRSAARPSPGCGNTPNAAGINTSTVGMTAAAQRRRSTPFWY